MVTILKQFKKREIMIIQFLEAMNRDGLNPNSPIVSDGLFHRFPGVGKPATNKDAWYVLYGDYGAYGDHSSDLSKGWSESSVLLPSEEKTKRRKDIENAREMASKSQESYYESVALVAQSDIARFPALGVSDYLTRKGIAFNNFNLSYGKDDYGNFIAIPKMDVDGKVWSYEKIYDKDLPDGSNKRPLKKGKGRGLFYPVSRVGIKNINDTYIYISDVYLCEGVSTGMSVSICTKKNVLVTFGIGNFIPVIEAIRAKNPTSLITIIGDLTDVDRARKIAKDFKCNVIFPKISSKHDDLDLKKRKDWNDLIFLDGVESGKSQLSANENKFLTSINVLDLLDLEISSRPMLISPIIPEKGLCMLYAPRGIGKTYVALNIAHAVASGGGMFDGRWKVNSPKKVLYVDGEMPILGLKERIGMMIRKDMIEYDPDNLIFISSDYQEGIIPDLSTSKGQSHINEHLDGVKLLILDNLSCLCRSGNENDAESWTPVQEWLIDLKRKGIAVLLVHHAGKNGQQRGTSKREDVLDTVICLKRSNNSEDLPGAKFEVHYEKSRGFSGDEKNPFEVSLVIENSHLDWKVTGLWNSERDKILDLYLLKMSQRDIAKEVGVSLGKVMRTLKKARSEGTIS